MSNAPPVAAASGTSLPAPLAQRIAAELQPGEVLIWTGQPVPAVAARGTWIFSVIGGVMLVPMLIVAAFIMSIMLVMTVLNRMFGLMGICFMLFFGFGLLAMMSFFILLPWLTRRAAANTAYALTNRRVIVLGAGAFAARIQSFGPQQLGQMFRTERVNGTGSLVFQQYHYYDADGHHVTRTVGFTSIAGVRDVEALVRATLLNQPAQMPGT